MDPRTAVSALAAEYKSVEAPPYAAFTGTYGRAWLVQGADAPVGYIDPADGTGRQTFTNLAVWQAAVEAGGITTPDSAAPPADAAAAPAPTDQPAAPGADPTPTPQVAPAAPAVATTPTPAAVTPAAVTPAAPPVADAPAGAPVEDATDPLTIDADPVPPPPGADEPLFDAGDGGAPDAPVVDAPPADTPEGKGFVPFKKGDGPKISVGSWVKWGSMKGRVDLVVTDGTVPGVDGDVTGTSDKPVARVVEWGDSGATKTKHAVPVSTLKSTFPLSTGKKTAADGADLTALIEQAAVHGVTETAVHAAYQRGVKSWPGFEQTRVTRAGWAAGRAAHLVKAAVDVTVNCNDRDLLTEPTD